MKALAIIYMISITIFACTADAVTGIGDYGMTVEPFEFVPAEGVPYRKTWWGMDPHTGKQYKVGWIEAVIYPMTGRIERQGRLWLVPPSQRSER